MSNSLQNITTLITSLPNSDLSLGMKFLKNRQFESLKELVDSAIIRVKKNIKSDNPRAEYVEVNMDKLNMLKAEVDVYFMQLELPQEEEEMYE